MYTVSVLISLSLALISIHKYRLVFALLLSIIAVFIVGSRSVDSGYDTHTYISIFENTKLLILDSESLFDIYLTYVTVQPEPLYSLFVYLLAYLDVSSEFFLFTVALFSFSIITCAILKISVKDSSYIIALMLCSFTYVFIFGNAIRQGIALSFAFYGFSYLLNQNNKKYYLCILVASLFHSSAFALMLLPILMKIRMRTFIIVFVVSFVLFVLVGVDSLLNMIYVPVISEKISHYLGSDPAVGWSFISVLLLPVLILFFIFCFNVNDGFLKISKLYFCLSLICMFFSFSSIMFDRISAYRFLFEPVVYLSFTSNFRQEYILKKVIVVIAFFYFLIVVFSAPSIHQTLGYS